MTLTEAKRTIRKGSVLEEAFDRMIQLYLPPECYHREYRFTGNRRYRFDFAWVVRKIAVELEGATWANGRHNRGSGFEKDCRKYNLAVKQGWRVLRFTRDMIASGEAIRDLQEVLKSGPK